MSGSADYLASITTSKHNRADCRECGACWAGPTAPTDGAFHEQVMGHEVVTSVRASCHEGCCDPEA